MNPSLYSLAGNEGRAVWFLNQLAVVKATAEQTGGAFGLVELLAPPGPASPYHVHRREDETFYVLEGEVEFMSDESRFSGGPGSYVFLPRGVPHGFRVVGTSPAKCLVLTTPGGFEGFVLAMGEPASTLALPPPSDPDMGRLGALAAEYGIEILGPLPD